MEKHNVSIFTPFRETRAERKEGSLFYLKTNRSVLYGLKTRSEAIKADDKRLLGLNGFKVSDINQLILTLIFRFGLSQ